MSRLAKKPIIISEGVAVEFQSGILGVRGPKGELKRKVPSGIHFDFSGQEAHIRSENDNDKEQSALLGTFSRHLQNMIDGVSRGFEKKLELVGIGFRAEVRGKDLMLSLGFSHPITIAAPPGISFAVEKNTIIVSGTDKELVGNIAAKIRQTRKPEPYKGKGIKYASEIIRRKAGKKVVAAGS